MGSYLAGLALVITALGKILVDVRSGNRETAKIHKLVNSRMTEVMEDVARLARLVAVLTGDPADVRDARKADTQLEAKKKANGTGGPK